MGYSDRLLGTAIVAVDDGTAETALTHAFAEVVHRRAGKSRVVLEGDAATTAAGIESGQGLQVGVALDVLDRLGGLDLIMVLLIVIDHLHRLGGLQGIAGSCNRPNSILGACENGT